MLDTVNRPNCEFSQDVIDGLSEAQKSLPCKYFYDEKGSALFEQITQLAEYYPTRTELNLLSNTAHKISSFIPQGIRVVEYGAGALRKIRLLLDALDSPTGFVPIDVSEEFLLEATTKLQDSYPSLQIDPVIGNFLDPELFIPFTDAPSLGFFPGSTLGNLSDADIHAFLSKARHDLGPEGLFLLGVDINQDPRTLIPAYNDAQGITEKFNINILERIDKELDADFDTRKYIHNAIWNETTHTIEMHLISTQEQTVTIGKNRFSFRKNETIHTENSRKFSIEKIEDLAKASAWKIQNVWRSPSPSMALILLS